MRIAVKTGGLLGKYLPAGGARNSAELEVPEGATASDVIARLGMPPEGGYLVIHNGVAVPKAARAACRLAADDELAIMPPLKGG
jgi:sulfur carrier protein ThiS